MLHLASTLSFLAKRPGGRRKRLDNLHWQVLQVLHKCSKCPTLHIRGCAFHLQLHAKRETRETTVDASTATSQSFPFLGEGGDILRIGFCKFFYLSVAKPRSELHNVRKTLHSTIALSSSFPPLCGPAFACVARSAVSEPLRFAHTRGRQRQRVRLPPSSGNMHSAHHTSHDNAPSQDTIMHRHARCSPPPLLDGLHPCARQHRAQLRCSLRNLAHECNLAHGSS